MVCPNLEQFGSLVSATYSAAPVPDMTGGAFVSDGMWVLTERQVFQPMSIQPVRSTLFIEAGDYRLAQEDEAAESRVFSGALKFYSNTLDIAERCPEPRNDRLTYRVLDGGARFQMLLGGVVLDTYARPQ